MYNKVTLIGRLGKDPEIRSLDQNTKVAKFTMATNESYKDKDGNWQDKTEWHNVVAWNNLADRVERSLKTGMLVFVEGKVSYRKYTDKEGNERYVTDISAAVIKPLEKVNIEPPPPPPPPPTDKPKEDDDLPF